MSIYSKLEEISQEPDIDNLFVAVNDVKDSVAYTANCLMQQSKIAETFSESLKYHTIGDIEEFAKKLSEKLADLSKGLNERVNF